MIKVIVFDFDGVIVDSNQVKYDAWFEVFPSGEEIKKTVIQVLDKHRERSRFFIIKEILIELKNKGLLDFDNIDVEVFFYAKKYNDIVESETINCKEVKGAKESLEPLLKRFPLYINSGTPLDKLKLIIQQRSLSVFFKNIYGSPGSKIENLSEILRREKIKGSEVLVVGDGWSDLESAQKFGCKFIGIRNSFNNFIAQDFDILDDLQNLPNLVENFAK
ncbi:MAG: HAD-IA family hydrolase [Candidatus Nealsonbacteria bacterium]